MHKRNTLAAKMKKNRQRSGGKPASKLCRPLLSATGAVVGAGMMVLAFTPSRSEAAAALDAMPWLPAQVPVQEPDAFAPAAVSPKAVKGAAAWVPVQPPALLTVAAEAAPSASRPVAIGTVARPPMSAAPVRVAQPDAGNIAPRPSGIAPLVGPKSAAAAASLDAVGTSSAPVGMTTRPVSGWRLRSADVAPDAARNRDGAASASAVHEDAAFSTTRTHPAPVDPHVAIAFEPSRVAAPNLHATTQHALVERQTQMLSGAPLLVPVPAHGPSNAPLSAAALASSAQAPIGAMTAVPVSHASDVVMTFPNATPRAKKHENPSRRAVDEGYAQWLGDAAIGVQDPANAPVPEHTVVAALQHAAQIAADRSADVRQARSDWEAAGYDTDAAKGARWPQLQIGGYSPSIRDSNTQFNDYNRAYANINLSTTVYDWGKNSKTIESRSKTAAAAEAKYIATAQQNAFDISSNLIELSKTRASYEIGVNYVRRMSALVDMLAEIVKADPGRLSELTQAKARLLQAQTSQDQVATRMRELELAVKKLIGDEPAPMPASTRWQLHVMSVDDAVAAIDQNPAIAQAAAEQEAADAYAKSVRAAGLPQVNWVVTKSTGRDEFGQRQPWSTMLQLAWTPFSGGTQTANERAALARAASSGEKKDQLRLDSEYNVRQAHRDALALAERARLYGEVSSETELVRKQFFEQWYHLNRRTLLDVLLAESDFYANRVAEVTTQFDAYQAVLKMRLSSGTLLQWLQNG